MNRPNILYIHSHDTGRYIQPFGHALPTPNMQRLAEQGVLFRQAFCANPTCSPSRAALLTGQCAHANGMTGLAHRGFRLNNYEHHLANTLKRAGYATALAGVQHEARLDSGAETSLGYDEYFPCKDTGAGRTHSETGAVAYLSRRHERPFFLAVGFSETHREYAEPGPLDDPRYLMPPAPIPDTPETRRDMAAYRATVRVLDAAMGEVFDALDANGLTDNTLVICTTDHGLAFPRMKSNLTDDGIGVYLIMRGPGGFMGGKVVDSLVSQLDVFPTVCALAGIDPPAWLEGVSLLPVVRGETDAARDEIFAEVNYHAAYEPQRCVRTNRWKYIRRYDRMRPVLSNIDRSPSKDVWIENGWRDLEWDEEQLYDLVFDPHEQNNIARHPRGAAVLVEMRARLDRWMRDTNDPLLKGPVPAPADAYLNSPDDLHPNPKPAPKPS